MAGENKGYRNIGPSEAGMLVTKDTTSGVSEKTRTEKNRRRIQDQYGSVYKNAPSEKAIATAKDMSREHDAELDRYYGSKD